MTFLNLLEDAIERYISELDPKAIQRGQEFLTQKYRSLQGSSSVFTKKESAAAYLITRCPPIFSLITSILSEMKARFGFTYRTLLDFGAGPGTASWAFLEVFPEIEKITLYERHPEAISLGKELFSTKKMEWISSEIERQAHFFPADIAVASYSLGELTDPIGFTRRIWQQEISHYLFIEPGTPKGFSLLREVRKEYLALGATILAPCPHAEPCPIPPGDWCHFSQRIFRTKLHKRLKKGTLGYEDEKYIYLFFSKEKQTLPQLSRVIRHPQKGTKKVGLTLCTFQGNFEKKEIFKGDPNYRLARKLEWGSLETIGDDLLK